MGSTASTSRTRLPHNERSSFRAIVPLRHLPIVCFLACCLAALGCTSTPPVQGIETGIDWTRSDLATKSLRVRMNEFADRFQAEIASAADEIAASAGSPIDRRALVWKSESAALCDRSAYRNDPLGAFIDTWCLCVQMREYLTDGSGHDLFGEYQPTAIAAAERNETLIAQIAQSVVAEGKFSRVQGSIHDLSAR